MGRVGHLLKVPQMVERRLLTIDELRGALNERAKAGEVAIKGVLVRRGGDQESVTFDHRFGSWFMAWGAPGHHGHWVDWQKEARQHGWRFGLPCTTWAATPTVSSTMPDNLCPWCNQPAPQIHDACREQQARARLSWAATPQVASHVAAQIRKRLRGGGDVRDKWADIVPWLVCWDLIHIVDRGGALWTWHPFPEHLRFSRFGDEPADALALEQWAHGLCYPGKIGDDAGIAGGA